MLNIAAPDKNKIDTEMVREANAIKRLVEKGHELYTYFLGFTDPQLEAAPYNYTADDVYALRAALVAYENMYLFYKGQTLLNSDTPETYIKPLISIYAI